MNLDIFKNLASNRKDKKFIDDFINELSKSLETNNELNEITEEKPIIEKVLSNAKLTTGNKNEVIFSESDIIKDYAKKTEEHGAMYFVHNKVDGNSTNYLVWKIENSKVEKIEFEKSQMQENTKVNDVFRMEDGKYILDSTASKEIQEEIENMVNEILEEQERNLEKHRKEGHLYVVTEEADNNRFLKDITENSDVEFEEVNIPEDLLEKATEGMVLIYSNGEYKYYSDDGFER